MKSPGQVAFEAFFDNVSDDVTAWEAMVKEGQEAWERAASQVIEVIDLPDARLIRELHEFLIGKLKPFLEEVMANPMALMSGGTSTGMPGMPPPPVRSRK